MPTKKKTKKAKAKANKIQFNKPMTATEAKKVHKMVDDIHNNKKDGFILVFTAEQLKDGLSIDGTTYCKGVDSDDRTRVVIPALHLRPEVLMAAALSSMVGED